jgi:GNAT superfamily N-acetyltransferase
MTVAEFAALRPRLQDDQAAELARSGAVPAAEAARTVAEELDRLLRDGPATRGHRLWTALDGDDAVGVVWVRLQERTDGRHAFAHRLWVAEDRRGRGVEDWMLRLLEPRLRDLQVASLALMVLGDDARLRATCEREDYAVTAQTMAKALT